MAELDGPPKSSSPPRLFVLAIGINRYDERGLRLKYATADAQAIADALRLRSTGLFDFVSETVLTDDNSRVTKDAIRLAFEELQKTVTPADTVIIFVAGHGKTADGQFYFLPQDFRYETEISVMKQGISQTKWEAWFSALSATNTLVLFDACESGSLAGSSRPAEMSAATLAALARANGRSLLTAATSSERAIEGNDGHGLFTSVLLEGLNVADQSADGKVDLEELAAFVNKRVPTLARQVFGAEQFPQFSLDHNFVLGRSGPLVSDAARVTRDRNPTHVVITSTDIRSSADLDAPRTGMMLVGSTVRLVLEVGRAALVAQKGEDVGYVDPSALAQLH